MERWLSKPRVLLGLCGVLLVAALNRRDPMVYGMFLFLGLVCLLGFVLPWLTLRYTTVHLPSTEDIEVSEGEGSELRVLLERSARWPAFMVAVQTEWTWAARRFVWSRTIPVLRAGRTTDLGRLIQPPCRGRYELTAVRLSSGFPLGLLHAQHTVSRPRLHVRVLPKAQPVRWPLPWDVTEDPSGELSTRATGPSFELGMLLPYQPGEPVGRVCWRASARVGELVIRHFRQSGSIRLRVAVEAPGPPSLGDPDSAGEQALRLAVGVCDAALDHGAQLFVYLDRQAVPLRDGLSVRRALAEALPSEHGFSQGLAGVCADTRAGEQVAVVVSGSCAEDELVEALSVLASRGGSTVVCIARARNEAPEQVVQAHLLRQTVEQAGFAVLMARPGTTP